MFDESITEFFISLFRSSCILIQFKNNFKLNLFFKLVILSFFVQVEVL